MRRSVVLGLAGLMTMAPITALAQQAEQVQAGEPKLRVMPGSSPAAGYLVLNNAGEDEAVLVAVGTEAYARGEIHESLEADGVYRMEQREAVRIAPGGHHTFRPGGYHLMFMQRQVELDVGDAVPVRLEFEDGSQQTIDFEVVPPTYR